MNRELKYASLLPGRNQTALTPRKIKRIREAFAVLGYQGVLEFDAGPGTKTRFEEPVDENDTQGKIVVGADIYPGTDVTAGNSMMDYLPAVAHEITHANRYANDTQLAKGHVDEAFTSLEAACWAIRYLNPVQIEHLVRDAMQRLFEHTKECRGIPIDIGAQE